MAYVTYKNLPAQQTEFELIQTRIAEADKFYDEYKKVLRKVLVRANVTGDVTASDIPDAPPAITYP